MIRSWVDDGVGRVHIDDAEHRNVLSLEHSQAIAGFDDVGAVVRTTADPVFCSRGVLDDLVQPKAPRIEVHAAFDALRPTSGGLPLPPHLHTAGRRTRRRSTDVVRAMAWLEALEATVANTLTAGTLGVHDTSAGSGSKR